MSFLKADTVFLEEVQLFGQAELMQVGGRIEKHL
jgi:hypothetical protein